MPRTSTAAQAASPPETPAAPAQRWVTVRCRRCDRDFKRKVRVGKYVTCKFCGETQPGPERLIELEELARKRMEENKRRREQAAARRAALELEPAEPAASSTNGHEPAPPPPPSRNGRPEGDALSDPHPPAAVHAGPEPAPPAPPRRRWTLGSILSGEWERG